MKLTPNILKIEPEIVCNKIETFIQNKIDEFRRDGIILGLSGGLDSTVVAYLSARSVGSDKVLGLHMPDKDSDPRHGKDARDVANKLGIKFQVEDITSRLDEHGIYDLLPIRYIPTRKLKKSVVKVGKFFLERFSNEDPVAAFYLGTTSKLAAKVAAYAKIKHRERMVTLYRHAEVENLLVVGAANKTEYLVGAFVKGGCDHLADIMPIRNLYYTQEKQLADYLGVPKGIINKPPDPDVIPGLNDKGKVYVPYETLDLILYGLENDLTPQEISHELRLDPKKVERIKNFMKNSRHMRELPYAPEF